MPLPDDWIKIAPKPRELTGTDQRNVFLSYRSVNRARVLNLYDVLHQQGHKVFLDQCVLKAGDELTLNLEQALETSQAGVLVWSSAAQDSRWVFREYQVMDRQATDKPGFSVRTRQTRSNETTRLCRESSLPGFQLLPGWPQRG